ncbi:MAG: ATP-binding protein [Sedimentisphaerales bacterium]|jgi:predicted AAA+ superfamily ATPase
MTYYTRTLDEGWLAASSQFPALMLTGPRQVGKTTFLRHICGKERRYVTLDDPSIRMLANNDPALFIQRYPAPVLIDEIQYAPGILPYIKMEVDSAKQQGAFWLTGSQQFHLMRGISETLAGRVAIMNMLGFSNRERYRLELDVPPFLPEERIIRERAAHNRNAGLKDVFNDIWTGALPAIAAGPVTDRDLFYSSYLQTYLQRDIRDLAKLGDEGLFLRFLKACAARTGQLLNLSELARDADVSPNTAKSWLAILQASFQVYLLPPYYSNITKRLVKRPKLYFLDTGLCAYLAEWASPEALEAGAMSGAIFETYVFAEILKSWWHKGKTPEIYYFRDKDGQEIDFLLIHNRIAYPVEAKKAGLPKSEWLRSFNSLNQLKLKISSGAVICLAKDVIPLEKNIVVIPVGIL